MRPALELDIHDVFGLPRAVLEQVATALCITNQYGHTPHQRRPENMAKLDLAKALVDTGASFTLVVRPKP